MTRTKTTLLFAAAAAAAPLLLPAAAARADFDVAPSVANHKIVTNAFTDAGPSAENNFQPFVPNVHVFNFAFDDVTNPYFAQDPGFHPQPGSGFTSSSTVRIGAVSGLTYYSGTGPVSFGSAPTGTTLGLTYGSGSLTVGTTAPAGTLLLGTPDTTGEFDRHLGSALNVAGGANPTDGIYRVDLQLSDPGLGLTASDPTYALYGLNAADAAIDAAKVYLRDNFAPGTNLAPAPAAVPEPASVAVFGLVGVTALGRRRRSGN